VDADLPGCAIAIYLLGAFFTFSCGGLMALVAVIGLFAWRQKSIIAKVGSWRCSPSVCWLLAGMFWSRKEDFSDVKYDTSVNQRLTTLVLATDI
jgi:hypothetical protein